MQLARTFKSLGDKLENDLVSGVLNILYYALPKLEYVNVKSAAVHGVPISLSYPLITESYGVAYAAFVMVAACMIFSGVISGKRMLDERFEEGDCPMTLLF